MCYILKVIFLFALLQIVLCQGPAKLEAIWRDCQTQGSVTDEELSALYNEKSPNPGDKAKCHVKCVMEKLGFFKNDAFDGENVLKILSKTPKYKGKDAELNQAVKDCKDVKGSNACDTAFLAIKCFREHPSMELFSRAKA